MAAAFIVATLAVLIVGPAAAANPALQASASPCSLSVAGVRVSKLKAGSYAVLVKDLSRTRRFELTGPGVKRTTSGAFVGTTRWRLRLVAGTYTYRCRSGVGPAGRLTVS